jgi:hypothetical protein
MIVIGILHLLALGDVSHKQDMIASGFLTKIAQWGIIQPQPLAVLTPLAAVLANLVVGMAFVRGTLSSTNATFHSFVFLNAAQALVLK